jgi:prepilin signal peptidase PulO-like enzyme (type II secretory pathway)
VEAATGGIFVLVALVTGHSWSVFGLCFLAGGFLPLVLIEHDKQVTSKVLPIALYISGLGALALLAATIATGHWTPLEHAGVGLGVAGLLTLVATFRGPVNLGYRATGSLLPLGLWLGWLGGTATLAGVASTLAVGVALVAVPRGEREKRSIPLAAACGAGAAVSLIVAAIR